METKTKLEFNIVFSFVKTKLRSNFVSDYVGKTPFYDNYITEIYFVFGYVSRNNWPKDRNFSVKTIPSPK